MSKATPERAGVARRAERPAAGLLLGTGATLSVAHTPPQAVAERGPEGAALVNDGGLGMRKVSQPSTISMIGAHVAQQLGLAAQAVRRAVGHTGRRRSTGKGWRRRRFTEKPSPVPLPLPSVLLSLRRSVQFTVDKSCCLALHILHRT